MGRDLAWSGDTFQNVGGPALQESVSGQALRKLETGMRASAGRQGTSFVGHGRGISDGESCTSASAVASWA